MDAAFEDQRRPGVAEVLETDAREVRVPLDVPLEQTAELRRFLPLAVPAGEDQALVLIGPAGSESLGMLARPVTGITPGATMASSPLACLARPGRRPMPSRHILQREPRSGRLAASLSTTGVAIQNCLGDALR